MELLIKKCVYFLSQKQNDNFMVENVTIFLGVKLPPFQQCNSCNSLKNMFPGSGAVRTDQRTVVTAIQTSATLGVLEAVEVAPSIRWPVAVLTE